MKRLLDMTFDRTRNILRMAHQTWRDPRVPLLARIFVIVAPLYWINPFDLIPDLQPGGQCDDITIAFLLFVMALRLVPPEVFQDAHKTVNPAVCGVMCVSLLGIAASPAGARLPGKVAQLQLLLAKQIKSKPGCTNTGQTMAVAKKCELVAPIDRNARFLSFGAVANSVNESSRAQVCKLFSAKERFANSPASSKTDQQLKSVRSGDHFDGQRYLRLSDTHDGQALSHRLETLQTECVAIDGSARRVDLPAFIRIRGGQRQLYSSEDASAVGSKFIPECLFVLPPPLASGIFVAHRDQPVQFGRRLSPGRGLAIACLERALADRNLIRDSNKTSTVSAWL